MAWGSLARHGGNPYAVSVVSADGGRARTLFPENAVFPLALSPDRRLLAFSRGSYLRDELAVSSVTGANTRRVAAVTGLVIQAEWSPDGRRLAFSTDNGDLECRVTVWVTTADAASPRKLAECAGNPAWAPDSRRVAYLMRGGGLRVADADTGDSTSVAPGAHYAAVGAGVYETLTWSPRGDWIAYLAGFPSKLRVVRVADGKDLALAPAEWGASWSPDGRQLAFPTTGSALAVINRDGSHFRILDRRAADEILPAWSPDGRRIAYVRRLTSGCGCRAEVYAISPSGLSARRLTNETAGRHGPGEDVQFGPVFWSRDSRRVFYLHYVHVGH